MNLRISIVLILSSFLLQGQVNQQFRVYLKDKGSSVELLSQPECFLSPQAIARRELQGIAIDQRDLPLAPEYKQSLRAEGAKILAHSKWLNYCYIEHPDPQQIADLDFVARIEYPRPYRALLSSVQSTDSLDYGYGTGQIRMLKGDKLHLAGYTGQGVSIAVIDVGYQGSQQASCFDSLNASGRLLGTYNFVNPNNSVFSSGGSHGSSVLSIMASFLEDTLVGTAPQANYWLFTTEDLATEDPVEMDYWAMAAEYADSVGAQIIQTSLSYTQFSNAQFDFTYSDMDGNTALITRAADLAASKGMLVVASAGNYGDQAWQYIGAPADGDSVLTVGSVSFTGNYSGFSAIGPTADGRVKPDVMAQGGPTTLLDPMGVISFDFGTSYAAPLVSGLAACLMQAYPSLRGDEIAAFIRQSAHLYASPNDSMGYGIPNFEIALSLAQPEFLMQAEHFAVYPNPVKDYLIIKPANDKTWQAQVRILDLQGRVVLEQEVKQQGAYRLGLNLKPGHYFLQVSGDLAGQSKLYLK